MSKFRNKSGELSQYALSCGYLQVSVPDGKEPRTYITQGVALFREGGSCYHVRAYVDGAKEWESFDFLSDARKFYTKLTRQLGLKKVLSKN